MGPPKKKKLKTSLNKLLNAAEANKRKKHIEQEHQARLAKVKQRQQIHPQHGRKPTFTKNDRVLLIGEGNFSFARALAEHYMPSNPGNIVATCFDSEQVLYEKYTDEAKTNVEKLKELGVAVLFEVDGTQLKKHKNISKNRYTKIIFNFPHAGNSFLEQLKRTFTDRKWFRRWY